LGLATYLGLNRAGLSEVADHFKSSLYGSAFVSKTRPRWWVSSVRPVVEQILGHDVVGSVASFREELLKAVKVPKLKRPNYLSKAYAHRDLKSLPDCVAYKDSTHVEKDRVQAVAQETHLDPRDENMPFGFEARRIFGPAPR
jgi:hypothetical protein